MATDLHALITARWQSVIEPTFSCPLYSSQATPQKGPPYAIAENVETNQPLNAGRRMATADVKITIYATGERTVQAIAAACGLESKVPTGFNREEIGTADVRATSIVSGAGLLKTEEDPPFGGGKCFSRVLMIKARMGTK